MNRFHHKGYLEIPYMYSNVCLGEEAGQKPSEWTEDKYNFLKFVLIGKARKKDLSMSSGGLPDRSEEQKIWSDDEISLDGDRDEAR